MLPSQVWDFTSRSWDFLNQLGCFNGIFILKAQLGIFLDFSELQVLNLVIKLLVKLAS